MFFGSLNQVESNCEGLITFPFFPLRIDYIFTSKNITVLDFKTYDIDLSDHKPILAKLQWP